MKRHLGIRFAMLVVALAAAGLFFPGTAPARGGVSLQTVSLPPAAIAPRLDDPRPEAPIAPRLEDTNCAACQLAARTIGQLPVDALQLRAQPVENGILLRVTAKDPEARETVWKATMARGELMAALRSGESIHLCDACTASLQRMRDLRISAQRTADGVVLLYTSANSQVVRSLYETLRDSGVSAQF